MKNFIQEVTLVLISYKSKKKIIKFLKNISKEIKVIIIENSRDLSIKDEKFDNRLELIFVKNIGYAGSINHARLLVMTKYFIVFNPDVENVDDKVLEKFHCCAKKLKDNFACLGPRYINIPSETLTQTIGDKEIDTLPSISGASMFFNKDKFDSINGFDDKFFLYFEETDYCYRAQDKGLYSYQINSIKLNHYVGTSVDFENDAEKNKINELYSWHFIWSKFYFYRKRYGFSLALINFIPLLFRTIFKIVIFKVNRNKIKERKYRIRLEGLVASIKGLQSNKRID